MTKILVVDDDHELRTSLCKTLLKAGCDVSQAEGGADALALIEAQDFDVALVDLKMPDVDGLAVLEGIRGSGRDIKVIILTAHATIGCAVEAMKRGAYDFLLKPASRTQIIEQVRLAAEVASVSRANRTLCRGAHRDDGLVGSSRAIEHVREMVAQVGPSASSVLVEGESGVGKEVVARAIHDASPRRNRAFVAVNCGAIPDSLLEAELFGVEKGAFTGAENSREGRFELADGGTIFLDEIVELSPAAQVKLLRVLQNGHFERLGSSETVRVDVRVIAATNKDLDEEMKEGRFREDLYYRVNVIRLAVPPLRDRREDIPELAYHFLHRLEQRDGTRRLRFTDDALMRLKYYPWPGNVRELENAVERAFVLARGEEITEDDLPADLGAESIQVTVRPGDVVVPADATLEEAERLVIRKALLRHGGRKADAARQLGIGKRTIYRKI